MWVIHTQVKAHDTIPSGTIMVVLSVSLDFKKCLVYSEIYREIIIPIYNLDRFRPVKSSFQLGMQFKTKEDTNEYVKRLSNPVFELPSRAAGRSGILIAKGEYTEEEVNNLMDMIAEWNREPYGAKLVLNGDFEFIYTSKIDDVKIVDGVEVKHTSERLSLVLDDLDD